MCKTIESYADVPLVDISGNAKVCQCNCFKKVKVKHEEFHCTGFINDLTGFTKEAFCNAFYIGLHLDNCCKKDEDCTKNLTDLKDNLNSDILTFLFSEEDSPCPSEADDKERFEICIRPC